jgi:hypothetical protein
VKAGRSQPRDNRTADRATAASDDGDPVLELYGHNVSSWIKALRRPSDRERWPEPALQSWRS